MKDGKKGGDILFDIRHLSHTFETEEGKKFDALSDVTASIRKGSFTAIIGTNGSGKSTLARHLNALLIPTDGEIYVEGMKTSDFSHIWDIRQKVGMVFQNPDNQLVAAIVEEDVAFGPENLGIPPDEIRKRVDTALEKVGMTLTAPILRPCFPAGRSSALPLQAFWPCIRTASCWMNRRPCLTPTAAGRSWTRCMS